MRMEEVPMRRIGRTRLALAVSVVCLAVPLALPGGASSLVTNAILQADGTLDIEGSPGNDEITLRLVPGVANPNAVFIEVHDPAGVAIVPSGCFRKDANTIHCPHDQVDSISLDLRSGDDRVENEIDEDDVVGVGGLPSGGGGVPTEADGGEGDDVLEGGDPPTAEVLAAPAAGSGSAGDRLVGGPGNDKLIGQAGNDKLFGGPGKDRLTGGPGKDKLACGGGKDVGAGGGGKDTAKGCERSKSL
jgi:Ca2+-binding RTX toxin-like protein